MTGSRDRLSERFGRKWRLRRRSEYRRASAAGVRVHTPHFVILVAPGTSRRLGITAGRKVGSAVERNRVKRLVREVFRRNPALFPDCDVVMIARPGARELDYRTVRQEVADAAPRLLRAARSRPARRPGRAHDG